MKNMIILLQTKKDVQSKLESEQIMKSKMKFYKNNKGAIFFKGFGENITSS